MHKASLTAPLLGGKTRILADPFLSPQHCTGWIRQDEGKQIRWQDTNNAWKGWGKSQPTLQNTIRGGGGPKDLLIYYKARCLQFSSHKWNTIQPYRGVVYFYKLSIYRYLQREGGWGIFWNCFSFVQADWIMTRCGKPHHLYQDRYPISTNIVNTGVL